MSIISCSNLVFSGDSIYSFGRLVNHLTIFSRGEKFTNFKYLYANNYYVFHSKKSNEQFEKYLRTRQRPSYLIKVTYQKFKRNKSYFLGGKLLEIEPDQIFIIGTGMKVWGRITRYTENDKWKANQILQSNQSSNSINSEPNDFARMTLKRRRKTVKIYQNYKDNFIQGNGITRNASGKKLFIYWFN